MFFWRVKWMLWTCFAFTGVTARDTYKFGWPSKCYQDPSNYCCCVTTREVLPSSGVGVLWLAFVLMLLIGKAQKEMSMYELLSMVHIPGRTWSFPVSDPLFPKQNHLFIIGIISIFWQSSIWGTCVRNKCQAKCKCYLKPQIRLEYAVIKGCFETSFAPVRSFSLSNSKSWWSGFCRLWLYCIIFLYISRPCIQQLESQGTTLTLCLWKFALFPWIINKMLGV